MGPQILIVEDDAGVRIGLTAILKEEGFVVDSVSNGEEALQELRKMTELPSVILLDLKMPIMDGPQFLAEQRKDERLKSIPVVILSADAAVVRNKRVLQISRYPLKPIQLNSLLRAVEEFCSRPIAAALS